MTPATVLMALFSIVLSTTAQVLLRIGMASSAVQQGLASRSAIAAVLAIARSPLVVGGLTTFGLSAVVWLLVLSRVAVSLAYPFVALGIAATVAIGHFMLGESVTLPHVAGVILIVAGVVLIGTLAR